MSWHSCLVIKRVCLTLVGSCVCTGDLDQCRSHPEGPLFLDGHFAGHYPCCGTQVHKPFFFFTVTLCFTLSLHFGTFCWMDSPILRPS
jgi:hypothetical protein